MDDLKKTISFRCTFCRSSQFALPHAGYSPPAGGFVVCANCGRENDITSLLLTAKAVALSIAEEWAEEMMKDTVENLKKSLKNNKYIKFK